MAAGDLFNRRRMLTQNVRPPRPTGGQQAAPSYNIPSSRSREGLSSMSWQGPQKPDVDLSQIRSGYQPPIVGAMMPWSPASAMMMFAGRANTMVNNPSADKILGRVNSSQLANPIAPPASPYAAQNEAMRSQSSQVRRTGQFMDDNPMASSSTDANRIARTTPTDIYNAQTAGIANGYSGNPFASTPGRSYARSLPMDQAGMQNIIDNQNPMYGDMQRRFNQGQTDQLAAQQAAVDAGQGVFIQQGGRGQNVEFKGFNNTPQGAEAAVNARRGAGGFVIRSGPLRGKAYNSPEAIAARKEFEAEKAAKHEAFKAANGGMNYAQARRVNQRADRMEGKFKKAVRQGLNPMSPQAFAMFPEQAGAARDKYRSKGQQEQNPMRVASDTFRPNGTVTPDSRQRSQGFLKTLGTGGTDAAGNPTPPSPFFSGLAGSEDNIQGLHFGIQEQVQSGLEPSDDDLQKLHAATVAMQSGYKTDAYDPFDMTYGAEYGGSFGTNVDAAHNEVFKPMYEELAGMENPTPGKLKEWWTRFKGRVRPDTNRFIGGSSILSGEGAPTVSPGGYEYPRQAPANPMRGGTSGGRGGSGSF